MKEQALKIHEAVFKIACGIREGGREVLPMAFFLVPFGGQLGVIQAPLTEFDNKDAVAAAIHFAAEQVGALYVIHICEAWSFIGKGDESLAAAAWIQAGNSLETFPGSVDIIHASMDGPDVNQAWTIEVKKDGSLGEPQLHTGNVTTGRFTNLSGRQGEN